MDCSLPDSSVHGILQAKTLEWVAISFSRDRPRSGIEPEPPTLAGSFFNTELREALNNICLSLISSTLNSQIQGYLKILDPMSCKMKFIH